MEAQLEPKLDGHILWLTLANPQRRNALTLKMLEALTGVLEAHANADVRAVVLRGSGERAFCAGYDLNALAAAGGEAQERAAQRLDDAARALETFPAPAIAALRGACFGAGGELAAACDLRVAAEDLSFAMPPAKLGLVYSETGLTRFVALAGRAATKELFFTAEPVDAERAVAMGLVNRVTPVDVHEETVRSLAETVAANAPLSLAGIKYIINRTDETGRFDEAERAAFRRLQRRALESEDYQEGVAAMMAKRRPEFRGT